MVVAELMDGCHAAVLSDLAMIDQGVDCSRLSSRPSTTPYVQMRHCDDMPPFPAAGVIGVEDELGDCSIECSRKGLADEVGACGVEFCDNGQVQCAGPTEVQLCEAGVKDTDIGGTPRSCGSAHEVHEETFDDDD